MTDTSLTPDRVSIQLASKVRSRRGFAARICALALLVMASRSAHANDKVSFGLDWRAEAEYGGFYQALAKGFYASEGLDVEIREGGPSVNHMQMMISGRLDFDLGGGRAIEFVKGGIPFLAVAAIFQKTPAVLLAHPGQGVAGFESIKGRPVALAPDARMSWWRFLAAKYGYTDQQVQTYTFNLAPFLHNDRLIQQGYLGSEPYSIKQAAGFEPVVLLASDGGYKGYGNVITTGRHLIETRPDVVKRFVDASIKGWYSYLYENPEPANTLIKAANTEMTDSLLDYGRTVMKTYGIVDSGDARTLGIGAMTDERWGAFYKDMVDVGIYETGIDYKKAFTLDFVNHKVGIELRQ